MDRDHLERLAGSMALDLLRAHLSEVRAASSVAELRIRLRAPLRERAEFFTRTSGVSAEAFETAFDGYAAELVTMQDPSIDRFGRLHDAARDRLWMWAAGVGVVILVALGSLLGRVRARRPQ